MAQESPNLSASRRHLYRTEQDDAQVAVVSGVSKNRDSLGLLLRLMVSERPEGDEESRWREPCTRCPLKRAQRWSTHAWLQRLTHKHRRFQTRRSELTGEKEQQRIASRDATSHWWQVSKNRSTDQIRSKASTRDKEGQRRDAFTQASRWIQISQPHITDDPKFALYW